LQWFFKQIQNLVEGSTIMVYPWNIHAMKFATDQTKFFLLKIITINISLHRISESMDDFCCAFSCYLSRQKKTVNIQGLIRRVVLAVV
jgi:hypothetical protein